MLDPKTSQIPNLRSLLPSRGGGLRGRGRGRGRGGSSGPERFEQESDPHVKDAIVQKTDQDAATSRMSAVELGYLDDPFAKAFTPGVTARRFPIMNRGKPCTYVRSTAIDILVSNFLETLPDEVKQIVSLGAGTDTRYFRILAKYPNIKLKYHELDFSSNTTNKIATIRRLPGLMNMVRSKLPLPEDLVVSPDGSSLASPAYNVHPIDLRTLTNDPPPQIPNLSPTTPTLVLSECCLIYLPPTSTIGILKNLTQHYFPPSTPVSLIIYEPFRPDDPFGRTMVSNLSTRGLVLETLETYPSLLSQRKRLQEVGFTSGQEAADTEFLWNKWIPGQEKHRLSKLEMLDDMEEWSLLSSHYCVAWGWRDTKTASLFGTAWKELMGQKD